MDLFGRKAKRKLEEFAIGAYRYTQFQDQKIKDLTEHRDKLQAELIEANLYIETLKEQLEATKKPPIKNQPLYLNETEEDIEYAYRNELINREEYEDMLRQLEFDNTNITFDLEAY